MHNAAVQVPFPGPMSYTGPAAIPVPRSPGIQVALSDLQEKVEGMAERVDRFACALQMVCLPSSPAGNRGQDAPRPATTPLGDRLGALSARLGGAIEQMDDVLKRLDV